jgi:tetratricopeptide (TPR) repeat protein
MKNKLLLSALFVIVLILVTYRGAFDNEFVDWDDFTYVVNNDLVRNPGESGLKQIFTTPVSSNYHPLTILSLRFNNNVCETCPNGISPAPFIIWNVIIHILNTILVLLLVYMLTKRNIIIALLTALLFGVHPMHVESVSWVSERKDVLYSFFFLSGLIAYYRFLSEDKKKFLWLGLSFLLFILSCLSKATAVVFPVVLLLLNFWYYQHEGKETAYSSIKRSISVKNLLTIIPFLIVSLVVGILAYRIQSGENFFGLLDLSKNTPDVVNKIGPFSIIQRFGIASYGFVIYLIKFFVPAGLYAIHPYPPVAELTGASFAVKLVLSAIAVMIFAVAAIWSLRKSALYFFSAGFYFVTIALVLQFITVGIAITSERYTYLPYIGLSLIPATLIAGTSGTLRKTLLVLAGAFILMLTLVSAKQVNVWSDTESLWTKVIDKHPDLEMALTPRGKFYSKKALQSKNEREKKIFEEKAFKDFSAAIKAGTRNSDVYSGAGLIYASNGDPKNAVLFLEAAIKLDPRNGSAYYNRAVVYDRMSKKEEAIRDYNMALIFKPDLMIQILNNRSGLLVETGRFREAILDFDYLISIRPGNYYYFSGRGVAKEMINDLKGAIADFQVALKLKPGDDLSQKHLDTILANQK